MQFKEAIYKHYISLHNSYLYDKPSLEKFRAHFAINEYYLSRFLPESRESLILDIGCGDGGLVYWLQQQGFKHTKGVDLSEEQIETGTSLGVPGLEVADLKLYLQGQANLDMVIARDVFEHFSRQDFFETLKQLKKALKEGGGLLVQLPNGQGIFYTSIFYGDITHEMAYTESSLRQLILAAGFTKIAVFPVNPYSKGAKGVIRKALWAGKVANHRFWKWIETGKASGEYTSNILAYIS